MSYTFSQSRTPHLSLLRSTLLKVVEVWNNLTKSGQYVTLFRQSRTPCHSLLSSTLLRGAQIVWNSLTKSG